MTKEEARQTLRNDIIEFLIQNSSEQNPIGYNYIGQHLFSKYKNWNGPGGIQVNWDIEIRNLKTDGLLLEAREDFYYVPSLPMWISCKNII